MKKTLFLRILFAGMTLTGVLAPSISYADKTIPVADFFKKAAFAGQPILSPDGKSIAVLTPRNGRNVLAVIDLDNRKPRVVASDPDWDIASPSWVNNGRLIFSLSKGSEVVAEEQLGGGLFAINVDGTHFRKLIPTRKEAREGLSKYRPYVVLQRVSDESNDLFVMDQERGRDSKVGASDVFRLDTITGRTKLLTFDNPGKVGNWLLDHNNVIRVAVTNAIEKDTKRIIQTVYHREQEGSPWQAIYKTYLDKGNSMRPLAFDFDNKAMFVSGRFNGRDKSAIHYWDFKNQAAGEIIADHPEADLASPDSDGASLILDYARKKIVGVYAEGMKGEMIYFDEDYAKMQATLDASFPNQKVFFSWRGDNVVISTSGDQNVGAVLFLDTKKGRIESLYSRKPELDGRKLSVQDVIHYKANDGLDIPAYLTLPEGVAAKNLPLIAYIHGGPHARDSHGYDPMTQMLASRGYAVLQPQFRMSTGFGWKHHTAGWKQWGLAMQDDITDGIEYLVKQGIVDKNRICIIGASYGGYATMFGLVKTPDLYKCGVNWVGVTDVKMLFTVNWSDMSGAQMDNFGVLMHGDPKTDDAYFKMNSAIENADKIKAPVLMGYGSDDDRVPLIHGEKMRDKLLAQGNTVEWMVMVGEGHSWVKESNRILWGESVLRFINRYIGDDANREISAKK